MVYNPVSKVQSSECVKNALSYFFGPETVQFFHYIANEAIYIGKQSQKKIRTYLTHFEDGIFDAGLYTKPRAPLT